AAVTFGVLLGSAYKRRGDPAALRPLAVWGGVTVVLGVLLWIPPVIDQFAHSPGNLGIIRDYFSHPPDATIGLHRGVTVLLEQLDPIKLVTRTLVHDGGAVEVSGTRIPGVLLLVAFFVAAFFAWRLRKRSLLVLDGVLTMALGLGLISSARIFGTVWFYLLLWAWALVALMLFAIGWTIVELVRARSSDDRSRRGARWGAAMLGAVVAVSTIVFAVKASDVTVQTPRVNETLGKVVGPTADALRQIEQRGDGGPYLVTWLPDAQ